MELEPFSLIINALLGVELANGRQYDQATDQLRKTLELDPNFMQAHLFLGQVYTYKSAYREAIAEYEALASPNDTRVLAHLGNCYATIGRRAEAERVLGQLKEASNEKYVPAWYTSSVYLGLGEKEKAFEWLEKSYDERGLAVLWTSCAGSA